VRHGTVFSSFIPGRRGWGGREVQVQTKGMAGPMISPALPVHSEAWQINSQP
jgi:hypothetical protein